jgi:ABC-type antimicrobial peptide transport system permease subunit
MGIRLGVGANGTELLAMLLREGMAAVCVGAAFGLPLSIAGSSLVRQLLHGSAANDSRVYTGATLMIAAIGLLASYVPARRAALLDPATALREE